MVHVELEFLEAMDRDQSIMYKIIGKCIEKVEKYFTLLHLTSA